MELIYFDTGVIRSPMAGEWFQGGRGPEQARFDFEATRFNILRQVTDDDVEFVEDGDQLMAIRSRFINIQESDCGFGKTRSEAYADLLATEGNTNGIR